MRLGGAGAPYGAQLRRAGQGVQRLARADRLRARTGGARRARRAGRIHRRRLSQRQRGVRRVRLGRDAGARRPEALRQPGRGDFARAAARAWPRAAALHRPRHSPSAERVGDRRIFPGGYPPTLAEVATKVLEPARMSIVDVENLRLHYARTLAHWGTRFAAIDEQVRARYGETFRRAWELYLAGSEAAFAVGTCSSFRSSSHRWRPRRRTGHARKCTAGRCPIRAATGRHDPLRRADRRRRSGGVDCARVLRHAGGASSSWIARGFRATRSAPAG